VMDLQERLKRAVVGVEEGMRLTANYYSAYPVAVSTGNPYVVEEVITGWSADENTLTSVRYLIRDDRGKDVEVSHSAFRETSETWYHVIGTRRGKGRKGAEFQAFVCARDASDAITRYKKLPLVDRRITPKVILLTVAEICVVMDRLRDAPNASASKSEFYIEKD